jgi:hypothetical protein
MQAVSKPVWHTPLLYVHWKTPDDGQRNCPKHVKFHSKNRFEKLMHLVGFIIRNLTQCMVTWMSDMFNMVYGSYVFQTQWPSSGRLFVNIKLIHSIFYGCFNCIKTYSLRINMCTILLIQNLLHNYIVKIVMIINIKFSFSVSKIFYITLKSCTSIIRQVNSLFICVNVIHEH